MAATSNFWERLQTAYRAASFAWRGDEEQPPLSTDYEPEDITQEQRKLIQGYALRWRYYKGDMARVLKVAPGKPDDNVTINHCRRVVDKGVAFLFGQDISFQLAEGKETEEEKLLDAVWRRNNKMAFLTNLGINGGVCGTFFVMLRPAKSEDIGEMQFVNLYPGMVFPRWDPSDVDKVWAWELRWMEKGQHVRLIYALDDDEQGWTYWREVLTRQHKWDRVDEPQVWPWPFSPIVHGQNLPAPNAFYGESDLEDADVNDAINFTASNVNRILRLYAHPVAWGTGYGLKDLDVSPGKAVLSSNDKARLAYLQMSSDLGSSMGYLQFLTDAFYQTAKVPRMDPDKVSIGGLSGFALRILYSDLLEKTFTKQQHYGGALTELNRRYLALAGKGDDHHTTTQWADPLPADEAAQIAGLGFDMQTGLCSQETASDKRGYEWETERARIAAEKAAQMNIGEQLLKDFDRGGGVVAAQSQSVGAQQGQAPQDDDAQTQQMVQQLQQRSAP